MGRDLFLLCVYWIIIYAYQVMSFVQQETHTSTDSVLLIDYMLNGEVGGYPLKNQHTRKKSQKPTKTKRYFGIILEQNLVKIALYHFETKIYFLQKTLFLSYAFAR